MEKQKIIHLQFVQMARLEPTEQVGPRIIPEEGKTLMDNNTTFYQLSLPWTTCSSMKVIHGQSSDILGRPNLPTPDGRMRNT